MKATADAMSTPYRVCTRCVMDTSAPDIRFDADGVCNYCTEFLERAAHILKDDPAARKARLEAFVAKVKRAGRGKPYDCVIGVSGGVDSSWALVKSVELGLRPLAAHMDNGWNSELAQNNIANLVRGLGVDLFTHVIDWEEYRSLMQAFFDADVIDIELLYDNAMLAVNFQQAAKVGVKFILAGSNTTSEGMTMPRSWHAFKYDKRNILNVAKRFGVRRIRSFPSVGTLGRMYFEALKGISWVSFLDYFEYNKFDAIDNLTKNYKFRPYPFKHYESIFTRFYQGYILPRKFLVDKRRVHLSTLVVAGQLPREQALRDLEEHPLTNDEALRADLDYFLKKMRWSAADLEAYLRRPEKRHDEYGSEESLYNAMKRVYRLLSPGRMAR